MLVIARRFLEGNFRKTAFAAYVFPKGRQLERDGTQRPMNADDVAVVLCSHAFSLMIHVLQDRARRAKADCWTSGPHSVSQGCTCSLVGPEPSRAVLSSGLNL